MSSVLVTTSAGLERLPDESEAASGSGSFDDSALRAMSCAVLTNDRREHRCRWSRCSESFQELDEMVAHVNDEHVRMEDVDYTCHWEGCTRGGRGFNARYKMLIHMRTHTNEKPHHCLTCGKCFSRLENLKIHTRSHTGEKPYVCPVDGCSKAYSNSSDRFKHTRTHFVDKPFVCKKDGCDKRYTDPSSLRKHMKTYRHRDSDPSKPSVQATSIADLSNSVEARINNVLLMSPVTAESNLLNSNGGSVFIKSEKQLVEIDLKTLTPSNHFLSRAALNSSKLPKVIACDSHFNKVKNFVARNSICKESIKGQVGPLDLTVNHSEEENSVVYSVQWGHINARDTILYKM